MIVPTLSFIEVSTVFQHSSREPPVREPNNLTKRSVVALYTKHPNYAGQLRVRLALLARTST